MLPSASSVLHTAKSAAVGWKFPEVLGLAACFGIFLGFTEGLGLLLFQRVNWERWGAMVHVSKDIIWISPLVDVLFFAALAVAAVAMGSMWRRFNVVDVLVSVFLFLAVYDWLTLTERLYRIACLLLATGIAVAGVRWFRSHRDRALSSCKRGAVGLAFLWVLAFAGLRFVPRSVEHHQIATSPKAADGAPNIVLIVIDTLRSDHLSSYGYSRPATPNLDALARDGILFENAIAPCSWTLPSHASLLTGRYPHDHGVQNAQPMPWLGWGSSALRGYRTLGEALAAIGYRTAAFSANQTYFTSNVGLDRGFMHFEDYFQSPEDMFLRTLYGREFERAYLHRSPKSAWTRGVRALGLGGLLDNRKHASEVNHEALSWIDQRKEPFFVFLNYIEVHDASALKWSASPAKWGTADAVDRYDSALTYVDAAIGRLKRDLESRGLMQNTLVVVTGDHGESLGQHYMQYHGIALYRQELEVPLLLWFPQHVPAGTRVKVPVSNVALASTIMHLAGERRTSPFPGGDLAELWNAPSGASWEHPMSELQKNEIVIDPDRQARKYIPTAMDGNMKSIVTPQWHLILHDKLGPQLYDWVEDPGEVTNLVATPEGRRTAEELEMEIKSRVSP